MLQENKGCLHYILFYFFLGFGFVCDSALPAIDFVFLLVLPSCKAFDAFDATCGDVCFLLIAILTPFFTSLLFNYKKCVIISFFQNSLVLRQMSRFVKSNQKDLFEFCNCQQVNIKGRPAIWKVFSINILHQYQNIIIL